MSEKLPDFFVVGAQKAGTSSLHDWLVQQPDVCLPRLKETQFFTFEKLYLRGVEWYLEQFPECDDNAIRGEVCPDYMFFPDAALRIKKTVAGSPKFIFIFRHPLQRAFSQYLMSVRNGHEQLSFVEALDTEQERLKKCGVEALSHFSYLTRGRYSEQVKRFKMVFPDSEMLFLRFEDLIDRGIVGDQTYAQICSFIGLVSSSDIAGRSQASNIASAPKLNILRDMLHKESRIKNFLVRVIPGRGFKVWLWMLVDRLNQKAVEKPKMGVIPELIRQQVADEAVQLEELTGLNLGDWHE